MKTEQMIGSHPDVRGHVDQALLRCIEECFDCARVCVSCADACLAEANVRNLKQCIRLNLDCADVCFAAGAMASRRTGSNEPILKAMLEVCAQACEVCDAECRRHAEHHEHCAICAATCLSCFDACKAALQTIDVGSVSH